MKISTKARYGARAILDLSLQAGKGLVQVKDIARRQQISESYLEQLMIPLRKAGLIVSIRGAKGGHKLAKHPADITLADVVEATEGSISFVDCVDDASICDRSPFCVLRNAWQQTVEACRTQLSSINFQQLAEEQIEKVSEKTAIYYI